MSIRSLAASEVDKETREKKHNERERFAVAAVAFCLKHDESFKRHFLRAVADLSLKDITEQIVEPELWGDLVLKGPKDVLVLEFKLGALLQDHQSPGARVFSKTGYGAKILTHFKESGKRLRYIVIGKDFDGCQRDGLNCHAVPWPSLLMRAGRKESPLQKDLYDCLGYLGAPAFLNRNMKKVKLAHDAKQAMTVNGALLRLLELEKIPVGTSDTSATWFGVNISKAGSTPGSLHAKLVKFVQPKGRTLGWIGYEIDGEGQPPRLCVWFYAPRNRAAHVRQRLEDDKGLGHVGKSDDSKDSSIYVRLPGDKSANDADWFRKVLHVVANGRT